MENKLIIYELNELPRKLLNHYIKIKPYSNLSKFKKYGCDLNTFTTELKDSMLLSLSYIFAK